MRSLFRFESNSAISRTEPIGEREEGGDSDHDEFSAVHARDEHGGTEKRERGKKNSAGEAESIGAWMFLAEHGKSGGDGAIDKEARDDGQHGVAGKISRDGKYQEQHGKNHNGDVRS